MHLGDNMAREKFNFTISGLDELDKNFALLQTPKIRVAPLRTAARKAMTIVHAAAINNAPELSKENQLLNPERALRPLKQDIRLSVTTNTAAVKAAKKRRDKQAEVKAVVKTTKATEDYALVQEYGRDGFIAVRTTAFGQKTKPYVALVHPISGLPYMRPALDDNVNRVLNTFYYTLGDSLMRTIKRNLNSPKAPRRRK